MQFLNHKTRRLYADKIKKVLLVFIAILLSSLLFYAHQSLLVIHYWRCNYGGKDCPKPVSTILQSYQGRSILRVNQNQVKKDILATGWGQNPRLSFTLPGTLKLDLEPINLVFPIVGYWGVLPDLSLATATNSAELRLPSLEIKAFLASQSGQHFQLTETGLLIAGGENSPISIIDSSQSRRDALPQIFIWIKELSYREIKFSSLFFLGESVILEQDGPPDTIFSLKQNPSSQIAALQEIKKAATIKDTKVIDFRYTNPILR